MSLEMLSQNPTNNTEQMETREKTERKAKEEKLEQTRQKTKEFRDSWGKPVDEGIQETVAVFNASELPTSDSCEGHIDDDGLRPPYIEARTPNKPERWKGVDTALEKIQPLKETNNDKFYEEHEKIMQEFSKKPETPEYQKWEEENKKLTKKSRELLEEFYKNRNVEPDVKLQIEEQVEENPKIYSGEKNFLEIIEQLGKETSEDEKRKLPEKLEKYRAEMQEFTKFLKKKYFES